MMDGSANGDALQSTALRDIERFVATQRWHLAYERRESPQVRFVFIFFCVYVHKLNDGLDW